MNEQEKEKQEKRLIVLKNRKRKQKRILLLLLLLMVTGVMLTTSSYAWFTSNTTVSVNDIQVNVAAQNGIQISADGTNWKAIVQTTDLINATATYPGAVNQIPATTNSLAPVSTGLNVDTSGKLEMYQGTIVNNAGGDYILTATKNTEQHGETGSFIAFDLFFKVDEDTNIKLTTGSGVKASGADKGIKNASRIAFVNLGNTAAGSDTNTIQNLNAGTSAAKYLWEPNYDVHTAAGVMNAKDNYGITTTETGGSLLAYSGVIAPVSSGDNIKIGDAKEATDATKFKAVTPTYTTTEAFPDDISIFPLTAGITKIRIYMWIEGQDVDCENTASGTDIIYSLQIAVQN